jgi:hypothetical protein
MLGERDGDRTMNVTKLSADTLDVASNPLRASRYPAPRMAADRQVRPAGGPRIGTADPVIGRVTT